MILFISFLISIFLNNTIAKGDTINDNSKETTSIDAKNSEKKINYKTFEKQDIQYKKRLWREINLEEPANSGFYAREKELVKFIIQGVKKGILRPFTDFKKNKRMTKAQFMENIQIPMTIEEHGDEDEWGENEPVIAKKEYFLPHQISLIKIEEEMLFHGRRSEWSYNIRSVQLILPQKLFKTGIRKEICIFDFNELMTYLDTIPSALWINTSNESEDKKFSLAFKERRFISLLVKIDNPGDYSIAEIYGAKTREEAVLASLKEENRLRALRDSIWVP